ncbi:hypothetical protein Y032_0039g144 [Ancylostoma ceylanicum]|uniref:Uncharacterized protein n=1 Tax=Ancylostoma ceylanicum TaxID=53326 RepID=A0A016UHW2_9BILA|nr:hypothetical protein Y032_0039g144 [Ancylostoma ceylanicum]
MLRNVWTSVVLLKHCSVFDVESQQRDTFVCGRVRLSQWNSLVVVPTNDPLAIPPNAKHCFLNMELRLWRRNPRISTSNPPALSYVIYVDHPLSFIGDQVAE